MAWSIETGLQLTDRVYVSSDSHYYLDMAYARGARTILRPPEICTDEAGDYEVIRHAIEVLGLKDGLIVYLRPTTPFRAIETIMDAISNFWKCFDSLRSVEEMVETAYKSFVIDHDGKLNGLLCKMERANLPNQQLPKTYRGNGYVDIVRPEYVLRSRNLWGGCQALQTERIIEIDTEEDLKYAEWWIKDR